MNKIKLLIIALISVPVFAQESSSADLAPPSSEGGTDGDMLEKINVVGSRIRQMDMEGATPVKVIDREEIENSAAHTVGGILQRSTLAPYGGDASRINVRGMGATRTLVLVNGKRLPKTGGSYGSRGTNVNAIPASVVERIEVLSDGASALYGSEALSSVINIVTRKNWDGTSISVKPGDGTIRGGEFINGSLTWARNLSGGYFSTSFDIDYSTELFSRDLDYIHPRVLRSTMYSDNYQTNVSYNQAFPACQEKNARGECTQYHGDINRSDGGYKISNYTEFSKDIGSSITFNMDFLGKYGEGSDYRPPYMVIRYAEGEKIPDSWMTLMLARNPELTDKVTRMSISHRLRGYESEIISQVYNVGSNIGLSGDLGSGDWMWSLNNNIGGYREAETLENRILLAEAKKVFQEERYNPFVGEGFSSVANEVFHDAKSSTYYFLNVLGANVDGPIFESAKTSLSLAAGAEWGYHKYREESDAEAIRGNIAGMQGVSSSGSRNHSAMFVELGANYTQLLQSQLAVRMEEYSDFGSTVNSKLALMVRPWERVTFRSSVGTGFKAPELSESRGGGQGVSGFLRLIDHVKCKEFKDADEITKSKYCEERSYRIDTDPNPAIQEETSISYNVGVVAEPSNRVTMKLDYWHYRVDDVIGLPRLQIFLKQQSEGKNPDMAKYGITEINRTDNADPDIDTMRTLTVANTGSNTTRGLDLGVDYKIGLRSSLKLDYSLMLEDYFELDGIVETTLGDYGQPRYRYKLVWDYNFPGEKHYLSVERVTVGKYKNQIEDGIIPEHSQYNMAWRWNLSPTKGELIVKANNLFNLHPRYDRRFNTYFNTSLYSSQSSYSIQYKVTF